MSEAIKLGSTIPVGEAKVPMRIMMVSDNGLLLAYVERAVVQQPRMRVLAQIAPNNMVTL